MVAHKSFPGAGIVIQDLIQLPSLKVYHLFAMGDFPWEHEGLTVAASC
jgi:hypothetical protein